MNMNKMRAIAHGNFTYKNGQINPSPFEIEHKKEQMNNMYDKLDIKRIEVHGYKEKGEDLVIFECISPNKDTMFITNTVVPRNDSEEPGDAGCNLIQQFTDKVPVLKKDTDNAIVWGT